MMPPMPWPSLQAIEDRHLENIRLLVRWAEINSGTHNLRGLAAMEHELVQAFTPLVDQWESLDLPPAPSIDSAGNLVTSPLGKALRFVKRPDAKLKVLLSIHYDTVFAPTHPFQHTAPLEGADALCGPGVVDAKGGIIVMLSALTALEKSDVANK